MSSDTDGRNGSQSSIEITLRRGEDTDLWIAEDVASGITSQGATREAALENLDEAVAGINGAGQPPSRDDLEALGIDPAASTSTGPSPSDPFDPE